MIRALLIALVWAAGALAQDAGQGFVPSGPNVTRWARGEIAYIDTATGQRIGAESWDLTAHPDKSRTLRTTVTRAGGLSQTVHLRVEEGFRPRELFAEYWINGVFRNATFIAIRGILADVTGRFAETTIHETVQIPTRFSFNGQPLASNVWHGWYYDKARGGAQAITVYEMDASAKQPYMTGNIAQKTITYIGNDLISVPAGAFPCDHYRIDDEIDYYVTGPDALFVKAVSGGTEYVLTKVEMSGP